MLDHEGQSKGLAVCIGIFALTILILNPVSTIPESAIKRMSFNAHWEIRFHGVVVDVDLIAPPSVVTMILSWFNTSAEIQSIDTSLPYDVEKVFIFRISHLLIAPNSGSFGWSYTERNMSVGDRRTHNKRVILSAWSVGLVPGSSTTLVYHIGVDLGVEDSQGTISVLNSTFSYPFEVIAGEDAAEYLLQLQRQQMMIYSIVGIIIVAVILGIAFFVYRKPKKEVL
ncbi:MAG: hypothetical protein ACFFBR_11170 [Promethearchaeota archaeon]